MSLNNFEHTSTTRGVECKMGGFDSIDDQTPLLSAAKLDSVIGDIRGEDW